MVKSFLVLLLKLYIYSVCGVWRKLVFSVHCVSCANACLVRNHHTACSIENFVLMTIVLLGAPNSNMSLFGSLHLHRRGIEEASYQVQVIDK